MLTVDLKTLKQSAECIPRNFSLQALCPMVYFVNMNLIISVVQFW